MWFQNGILFTTLFLQTVLVFSEESKFEEILARVRRQSGSPLKFDHAPPITFNFGGSQQASFPSSQGFQGGFFPNPSQSFVIPQFCRGNRIRRPECRQYREASQQSGGNQNSQRNPNCSGRRRNRPECQQQNSGGLVLSPQRQSPNCQGRRKRRPECQAQFPNQGGGGGGGNQNQGGSLINCNGNNRRKPECQAQFPNQGGAGGGGKKKKNCKGRRKNRPECRNDQINDNALTAAFDRLPWLQTLTNDNISLAIPGLPETPSNQANSRFYQLALGAQDTPFQQCVTPRRELGHCRFLQHCILNEFIQSFNVFLRYVCFIEGRYVGVCCPDSRYPDQTTPTQRPTTLPTTTQRPPLPPNTRGCGVNSLQQTKIVGGKDADLNKFPWAAALLRNSETQYCGGVLISNRHVLTAAHCVDGFDASSITMRLGEYSFDQQGETLHKDFGVTRIKMHENYDTTTYVNDIAIIYLDRSTDFSDSIWPICLPQKDGDLYTDQIATVIGWGTIYFGGPVSPVLQEVSIPVWKNSDCDAAYEDNQVFAKNLCAGDRAGGKDSCQGDSGGPLMLQKGREKRWTIIGVVSWGIRCADPGNPGVYARVSEFIDWIGQNTA